MTKEDAASERRPRLATRIMALGTLSSIALGVVLAGREVYRAVTDSFVAPIILSPDNDLIVGSKLKIAELDVERAKTNAEIDAAQEELDACAKAVARLEELRGMSQESVNWWKTVNAQQASAGQTDTRALVDQRRMLTAMIADQRETVAAAKANVEASLVAKTDYTKEAQTLQQLELALLDNERTRVASQLTNAQVTLAGRSLAHAGPAMPELMAREDQLVRIDLDIVKLQAEVRAKTAERRTLTEKVAKIDELKSDLERRPLYRAVNRHLDIAFVPYTQLDGVAQGASVLDCVWGIFACEPVGRVAELVPGEVVQSDPWGSQARGQYAVLELARPESAKSKTLRVRPGDAAAAATARPSAGAAISER